MSLSSMMGGLPLFFCLVTMPTVGVVARTQKPKVRTSNMANLTPPKTFPRVAQFDQSCYQEGSRGPG
jgi:hypothetical protein